MTAAGLLLAPAARSAPPPVAAQIEINFLLGYVDGSRCEFLRNGTWHGAQPAQVHLRDKFKYLVMRDQINSTEQFIDRAATESSLTGQPYQVRCAGQPPVMTHQWLLDELKRFRSF